MEHAHLRSRERPVARRLVHGLRHAARFGSATVSPELTEVPQQPIRSASARPAKAARSGARGGDQRHRRCAVGLRRAPRRNAGHAGTGVAGDSGSARTLRRPRPPPRLPLIYPSRQSGNVCFVRAEAGNMTDYLRLEAFRATPLVREPFEHLVVPRLRQRSRTAAINADYPKISSPGSFPTDQVAFGPAFQTLLDELEGERSARPLKRNSASICPAAPRSPRCAGAATRATARSTPTRRQKSLPC